MKLCTRCKDRGELPTYLTERGLTQVGVEIGVRTADYSKILLDSWPGFLHLVDPWQHYAEYQDYGYQGAGWDDERDYATTLEKLNPYKYRCQIHRMMSHEAVEQLDNGLDFVYIDGNHDYKYVWQDMRLWWGKLRHGGFLCGHDIMYMELPWVTTAVIEFGLSVGETVHVIRGSSDNICRDGQVPSWYIIKP